jgi:O-antigen/teichoic acid export membrane protein
MAGGAVVFAGTFVWQFSNFAFNSVAAHLLGPGRYGDLAAITGLTYLAGPVFLSIQTVTSRESTTLAMGGDISEVRGLLRYYTIRLALFGLACWGVVAALSGFVARVVHLPSAAPIAMLGSVFVLFSVTHLQRGVLQGTQAYGRYGLSAAFEGVVKVVAAVAILLLMVRTATAAVLAIPVAAASAVGLNWALLRFLPGSGERSRPVAHPYRYSFVTLATLILLAALASADVIAGRHYLGATTAGLYAAVSLSGRVVFFATASLTYFMFPLFSERQDRGTDGRRTLAAGLAVVALVSSLIVAVYFLTPGLLIHPLFGERFAVAGRYIGWMGIAFGLYGGAYLSAMYLLSQKRHAGLLILGGAVLLQLTGLYVFHASITRLIAVQAVVFAAAAAGLIAVALATRPGARRISTSR